MTAGATDMVVVRPDPPATGLPDWAAELDARLPVSPQVVITGNVGDLHVVTGQAGHPTLAGTAEVVGRCFTANGYDAVISWDPVAGPQLSAEAEPGMAAPLLRDGTPDRSQAIVLMELLRRVVADPGMRAALVVQRSHRLSPAPDDPDVHALYVAALHLLATPRRARPRDRRRGLFNTVVWIIDREADLPHWLLSADGVRVISVPVPGLSLRRRAAEILAPSLPQFPALDQGEQLAVVQTMAQSTEGMPLSALRSLVPLANDRSIPARDVEDAVRFLRSGLEVSPWQDAEVRERINTAADRLNQEVLGQRRAIRTAVDILSRAALGLSGAQSSGHPGRPQGVLFFAGPTGVGKTELAKQIAALVFGRAEAMVRFDMSEFAAEHTEARLLGAPPGYVGHEAGGELTNAVRQRPFCLLLFDEIEKAHPRILDKFLQILEDGRLTDGSGSTVHFSETLIVFTSNLGVYRNGRDGKEPVVQPGTDYDVAYLEDSIRNAVRDAFTRDPINRPELLNRMGDNIVVFDFISPGAAVELLHRALGHVRQRVYRRSGFAVEFGPEFVAGLEREVRKPERLSFGGRAVGSVVESMLLNPLARALLRRDTPPRCEVVRTVADREGIADLELRGLP